VTPSYTYQSRLAAAHFGQRGSKAHRLPEYDNTHHYGPPPNVYSTRDNPIALVRSFGECLCCGLERELVNHFCDVCRACGANEAQCLNTDKIKA
jgi:hypothetical protein